MTLAGLMQAAPLNIIDILTYAATAHGSTEIVSRQVDGPIWRSDYRGVAARAARGINPEGTMP